MFPHVGELTLIIVIVLSIFGVGRLPAISEFLARGGKRPEAPRGDAGGESQGS